MKSPERGMSGYWCPLRMELILTYQSTETTQKPRKANTITTQSSDARVYRRALKAKPIAIKKTHMDSPLTAP